MNRWVRKMIFGCLLFAGGMGNGFAASSWNGTSSGAWETPSNWNTDSLPASTDTVSITAGGTILTVTVNSPNDVVGALTVSGGSSASPTPMINLTISSGATLNAGTSIFATQDAAVNVLSGGTLITPLVTLGTAASGFYNYLNIYGGSTVNVTTIGVAGVGYLEFLGSGDVTLNSTIQDSGAGTGNVIQNSTGTTFLTGNGSGFSGTTTVQQGTLEIDNGTATYGNTTATVTVTGGTLRGSGTIGGAVTVNSGGTLAAGRAASTGTLTINGNLILNSGSATVLRAGSSGSDKIAVGGTAALGGTLSVTPSGTAPTPGQTFTLLSATGGVTSTFSSVTNTLANALSFTVGYTGNAVTVTSAQNSFTPFSQNSNQAAVARTLDSAASDSRAATLISYLDLLPGTSLAAAMQAISATEQAVVPPLIVQNAQEHINTLNQRMGAIRAGSTGLALDQINFNAGQIPLDSLIAGADVIPSGVKAFQPTAENKWGFFAAADGDVGEFTGGTGGQNSTFFGAGFDAGTDYRISPDLAVGFSTGYSKEKQDFDDAGSNVSVDTVRFGPYATWKDHFGDWLNASVGGAYHWFDTDRVGLGGNATSTTNGEEFDAAAKYGHDFQMAKDWTLTPTASLNYVHLDLDSYTESGSLAPLHIQEQTTESLRSELGGTIAYAGKLWTTPVSPWVQAGWAHEFLDTTNALNARLASGAGTAFTSTGADSGSEIATFGAGVNATLTERLSASLAYSGQANQAYQDHSFRASLRWDF